MHKFLIIQTAFIGDAILATAVLETLHARFPDAAIDLMVRKGNDSLFKGHPFLGRLWVWDKQKGKYKNLFSLIRSIRQCRYDYVINLQRFFSTGILTLFSGGRTRIGFSENPLAFFYHFKTAYLLKAGWHEVDRNHQLIADLVGLNPAESTLKRPKLYPSPRDYEKIAPLMQRPYICLAPGSVWFTKRLPEEKWKALSRPLLSQYALFLIGGPEDWELCDRIIASIPADGAVNLCGKLSLLQSVALMQGARMNYVNDSAPLHLASSVNAPTTVFFCSTVADFGFGPLAAHAVVAQIQSPLACRPCGIHGRQRCPEKHFKCGNDIDVLRYLP